MLPKGSIPCDANLPKVPDTHRRSCCSQLLNQKKAISSAKKETEGNCDPIPRRTSTSFERCVSSASVRGCVYFAETQQRRVLLPLARPRARHPLVTAGIGAASKSCAPCKASLRHTTSLSITRFDALSPQRFSTPGTSALVLSNADARASDHRHRPQVPCSYSLHLTLMLRSGAVVGDAISTTGGEGEDPLSFGGRQFCSYILGYPQTDPRVATRAWWGT